MTTTLHEQLTKHLAQMFIRNEFKYTPITDHLREMGIEVPDDVTEATKPTTTAKVVVGRGPEFYETKAAKIDTNKNYATKYGEFLQFKRSNPFTPAPGDDTPFIAAGPYGKLTHSLRHYKITKDIAVVYQVYNQGADRIHLDVYGFFTHADLGDSTTMKMGVMKQRADKFSRSKFTYKEGKQPQPSSTLTEQDQQWLKRAAGILE